MFNFMGRFVHGYVLDCVRHADVGIAARAKLVARVGWVVGVGMLGLGSMAMASDDVELIDASAVLSQLTDDGASTAGDDANKPKNQAEQFAADLKNFNNTKANLPVADQAAQWVALLQRQLAMKSAGQMHGFGQMNHGDMPQGFAGMVRVIPGPDVWPMIVEKLRATDAGRDAGEEAGSEVTDAATDAAAVASPKQSAEQLLVRLLADTLAQDTEAQIDAVRKLADASQSLNPWQAESVRTMLTQLSAVIDPGTLDASMVRQNFVRQIAQISQGNSQGWLQVPDLVTVLGESEAREILVEVVKLPTENLRFNEGERTKALARALIVEHIDEVPIARWNLVDSIEAVELFEALEKKFIVSNTPTETEVGEGEESSEGDEPDVGTTESQPATGMFGNLMAKLVGSGGASVSTGMSATPAINNPQREQALTYYVLGLIAQGRVDEAAARLKTLGGKMQQFTFSFYVIEQLNKAGFDQQVYALVKKLLEDDPSLPMWTSFVDLATRTGHQTQLIPMIEAALQRVDDPVQLWSLRSNLASALLAVDRVDEGVALYLEMAQQPKPQPDESQLSGQLMWNTSNSHGATLARLGWLLERKDWLDTGLTMMRDDLAAQSGSEEQWGYERLVKQLVLQLVEINQLVEAQQLVIQQIKASIKPVDPNNSYRFYNEESSDSWLATLVLIYHQAQRPQDVLALVEQAPYWSHDDLKDLLAEETLSESYPPLGVIVASALHAVNRDAEAIEILEALMITDSGHDSAYELYGQLRGQDAIVFYDQLAAADKFEERPLIWKADLLLRVHELEEAEAIVKQAVAIDPSDGEQGRGDRMRVYDVWRKIAMAKGDQQQAQFLANVNHAIRMSEDADRLYSAGLLTRGITMYQEALTHFANAYCIQSRLAVQLSQLGLHEEAAEHYRRAFELMPDSFGRMESHCFGCEGVFSGTQATSIAEQVFSRLLEQRPDNPQLHYLLGYLRSSQNRYKDAGDYYQKAVELDPMYINAWEKLLSLAKQVQLPTEVRDQAAFTLLQLDPLGRHTSPPLDSVHDLKGLWQAVQNAGEHTMSMPDKVFKLEAAAAAQQEKLEAMKKMGPNAMNMTMGMSFNSQLGGHMFGMRNTKPQSIPGEVLAKHKIIQAIDAVWKVVQR